MDAFWATLRRHPVNCGRGLPVLIDQVEPQLLEVAVVGRGVEPGDGLVAPIAMMVAVELQSDALVSTDCRVPGAPHLGSNSPE